LTETKRQNPSDVSDKKESEALDKHGCKHFARGNIMHSPRPPRPKIPVVTAPEKDGRRVKGKNPDLEEAASDPNPGKSANLRREQLKKKT